MRWALPFVLILGFFSAAARGGDEAERKRLADLSEQIARDVERLRGWEFQNPEKELRADEAFLKTIGAIPDTADLKQEMLDVMTAQVAGYYDPKDKTFYI